MLVRFYDRLIVAMAYLAGLMILAMSLWISYEVVARYVFLSPTIWAADLSEYALLWSTFLAAPWVLRRDAHVRVEVFVDVLGLRAQRVLGFSVSLIAAIACAILALRSGFTVYDYYDRGLMIARIWQVPRFIPYMAIPLGSTILTIECLRRTAFYLRATDPEGDLRDAKLGSKL